MLVELHWKTIQENIPIELLLCFDNGYKIKKITHMWRWGTPLGHTSEFLFGIYWWTWKINNFQKNCWSGPITNKIILIFTILDFFLKNKEKHLYILLSTSWWYDLQFLRYRAKHTENDNIRSFFILLPP